MKYLYLKVLTLLFVQISFAQVVEVTHQSNGTVILLPIESIDSVRVINNNPIFRKTVYQNNGNILGLAIQDIDSITYIIPDVNVLPTLTTSQITSGSASMVFSGGNITASGGEPITQRGVCWNTSPNPTIANNFTIDGIGMGAFTSDVLPLNPSTIYYLRAYAINQNGTAYGNVQIFTTPNADPSAALPIVTTNEVTYQDGLIALGGGNVSVLNGTITSRGVCWAIGTTPTINSSHSVDGQSLGQFSSSLQNLHPNTIYKVRAYATSDAGVAYGEEVLFKTHNYPSVFEISSKFVFSNSATLELAVLFDGNSNIIERGVCWSTQENPTKANNNSIIGSGEGYFYKVLTNLIPNTIYYARPFATNAMGTSYGSTVIIETSNSSNLNDIYEMLYEPMGASNYNQTDLGQKGIDIYLDILSSDMALSANTYGLYQGMADLISTVDASNSQNKIVRDYYKQIIHATNTVIVSSMPLGALPSDNETRWTLGQALALRAHSYFYLTQCFQEEFNTTDVILPLYTGEQYDELPVQMGTVYDLITSDLQSAISLLNNYTRPSKTNIDKRIAQGILTYVYAAMGNNAQVKILADDIVNNSGFPLTPIGQLAYPGFGSGFNDVNAASWMWGIDITQEMFHQLIDWWGQMDYFTYGYANAGDRKSIDTNLLASISTNDVRKIQYGTTGVTTNMPINKFFHEGRIANGQQTITTDYLFMRIEEFYLLSAEASANTGDETTAKNRLKALLAIRLNGGATAAAAYVDPLTGQALKDAIYLQTRIELWGEGKSYLALKRNQALVTRGTNHVFRSGESFMHNSDELTFDYSGFPEFNPPALESLIGDAVEFSATTPVVLNENVTNLSFEIPYITESGGVYQEQQFTSNDVTGLTASINAGTFNAIEGILVFNVTGIPSQYGNAKFNISIGGQNCVISIEVIPFQSCNLNSTILSIEFDNNPEETYWKICSASNPSTPLFSGGLSGGYTSMDAIDVPMCLNNGDYILSFFDTNNNGLNGGTYKLYDLAGNTYAWGSSFSNQIDKLYTAGTYNNLSQVELSITFDYFPDTIGWKFYDSTLNVIATGGFDAAGVQVTGYSQFGTYSMNTFNKTFYLPSGQEYTFIIYDSDGNGLFSNTEVQGSYTVKLGETILASGSGNFGYDQTTTFTLP